MHWLRRLKLKTLAFILSFVLFSNVLFATSLLISVDFGSYSEILTSCSLESEKEELKSCCSSDNDTSCDTEKDNCCGDGCDCYCCHTSSISSAQIILTLDTSIDEEQSLTTQERNFHYKGPHSKSHHLKLIHPPRH